MEYEVCVIIDTPPRYMKLYRTLEDYNRCKVSKVVVLGNPHDPKHQEQHRILRELYEDLVVEFIDEKREKTKAERYLKMCENASQLMIRILGGHL